MKARKEQNPEELYLPKTTVCEMIAFKADDESTYTKSDFINQFLRIFQQNEEDAKDIAWRMGLTYSDVRVMFKIEAGTTFCNFHDYWMAKRLNDVITERPELDGDELAHAAGFGNRSSVWAFYNSRRYKKIAEELGFVTFPEPERQHHCW